MKIECLGASGEVGRSSFVIHTDKRILMDHGIKIFDESGEPQYPLPFSKFPDVAILSHAHLDHSGNIPSLYTQGNISWYATPPTRDFCELLWLDSMKIMGENLPYRKTHFYKALKMWKPYFYNKPLAFGNTVLNFYDAGHIAGSSIIDLRYENKKLVYTGDFKSEETRLHKGAEYLEDVDTLIIESTYYEREHPPRKELEEQLMEEIYETLENGGNVLLPSFALGRTQELISVIRSHDYDIPVYVDGMGRDMTHIYLKYKNYIKNPREFSRIVKSVNFVEGIPDKKEAVDYPSVIISSAGMMNGGPILNYLLHANHKSKIIFTGYCVEESNGWLLQNKGYIIKDEVELHVDLPWKYLDFSAHAGRSDILNFIKHANPEKIILVHGDNTKKFAQELRESFGYEVYAPEPGEHLEV